MEKAYKCELESNNTKNTATKMKVGTAYTGYLGSGFGSIHDNVDGQDLYSVELKKGQAYKLTFDKAEGTTVIKLLGKNVDLGTLWPSVESNDFCLDANQTFVAPYTGTYYLNIYNYSNAQYKYTTKITNVTPKTPSLSSVKAGNNAFTAKWKKADCTGYQIQYATDKNFKNMKTVNISGKNKVSATVKKLASNKKYYVRIRAYKKVDNKYAYSSWSKAKTVTTKNNG